MICIGHCLISKVRPPVTGRNTCRHMLHSERKSRACVKQRLGPGIVLPIEELTLSGF